MSFVPHKLGDPPDGPCLAVMFKKDEAGPHYGFFPLGSNWGIITHPTEYDKVIPAVLVSVSTKAIVFRCGCGQPQCTRKLRYVLRPEGHHPLSRRAVGE